VIKPLIQADQSRKVPIDPPSTKYPEPDRFLWAPPRITACL